MLCLFSVCVSVCHCVSVCLCVSLSFVYDAINVKIVQSDRGGVGRNDQYGVRCSVFEVQYSIFQLFQLFQFSIFCFQYSNFLRAHLPRTKSRVHVHAHRPPQVRTKSIPLPSAPALDRVPTPTPVVASFSNSLRPAPIPTPMPIPTPSPDASTLLRRGDDTPTTPDARNRPGVPRCDCETRVFCEDEGGWDCDSVCVCVWEEDGCEEGAWCACE